MSNTRRDRERNNTTLSHSSRRSVTKIMKPELPNAGFLARAVERVLD
jgi:hypothetical protein